MWLTTWPYVTNHACSIPLLCFKTSGCVLVMDNCLINLHLYGLVLKSSWTSCKKSAHFWRFCVVEHLQTPTWMYWEKEQSTWHLHRACPHEADVGHTPGTFTQFTNPSYFIRQQEAEQLGQEGGRLPQQYIDMTYDEAKMFRRSTDKMGFHLPVPVCQLLGGLIK